MLVEPVQQGSPSFLVAGGQFVELLFSASRALLTTNRGLPGLLALNQVLLVGLQFCQQVGFLLEICLSKLG